MAILIGRTQRALARVLLPDWAKSAWSAARIIRGLKSAGLTYRRSDMLADIRGAKDRVEFGAKIYDFPNDKFPDRVVMNESVLLRDRRYKIGFRSKVYYTETGVTAYEYTNMYSDRMDTKEGLGDRFIDDMNTVEINRYKLYQASEVTYIEHNQGWDY